MTLGDLSESPSAPWTGHSITPDASFFGRAKLQITYEDGLCQTVNYWIANTAVDSVQKYGQFIADKQLYTNTQDPFRRAPSLMTFQRTSNDFVLEDSRAWIAGLVDEAGAGPWVGLAMKQVIQPDSHEIDVLETFINKNRVGLLTAYSGQPDIRSQALSVLLAT